MTINQPITSTETIITYKNTLKLSIKTNTEIHSSTPTTLTKPSEPWCKIWEAANLSCTHITLPPNPTIIELGAGTGVVGLYLAKKYNGRFLLTDLPCALDTLHKNLLLNEPFIGNVEIDSYIWGESKLANTFDMIICCELIYFPDLFKPLIDSLLQLSNLNTRIVLGYKQRNMQVENGFWEAFGRWFWLEVVEKEDGVVWLIEARRRGDDEVLKEGMVDAQFHGLMLMSVGDGLFE